jgi:hypothetical protein
VFNQKLTKVVGKYFVRFRALSLKRSGLSRGYNGRGPAWNDDPVHALLIDLTGADLLIDLADLIRGWIQ